MNKPIKVIKNEHFVYQQLLDTFIFTKLSTFQSHTSNKGHLIEWSTNKSRHRIKHIISSQCNWCSKFYCLSSKTHLIVCLHGIHIRCGLLSISRLSKKDQLLFHLGLYIRARALSFILISNFFFIFVYYSVWIFQFIFIFIFSFFIFLIFYLCYCICFPSLNEHFIFNMRHLF